MRYYYPDNLEAPPMWFFWTLRDIAIITISIAISVLFAVYLRFVIPLVLTAVYAVITFRFFDVSIYDYLSKVGRHFLTSQQIFFWEEKQHESV